MLNSSAFRVSAALFMTLLIPCTWSLADEPLRIGATLPLTGDLATYGNLIRGGIELAAEDLKHENISTELFFEDTPLSGAQVISGVNKLITVDMVQGIAGNFSNVAMAAMGPTVNRAKIPTFHTAAADPLIVDSGEYVITTNVRIRDEAYEMANRLYGELKIRKVAIISIQTNFGQAYGKFFKEKYVALGGTVVADENYEISAPDYRAQLTRIAGKKPEAVYAASFGRFLGYTLKQAREIGITAPFFSVYESEDDSVLAAAGAAANGLHYLVTTSAGSSPHYAAFRDRYFAKYHSEPGTFGSNAYDATMILGHALHTCAGAPECTLKNIYAVRGYEGISGTFSVESDGATKKGFILRKVQDGKFVDAQLSTR